MRYPPINIQTAHWVCLTFSTPRGVYTAVSEPSSLWLLPWLLPPVLHVFPAECPSADLSPRPHRRSVHHPVCDRRRPEIRLHLCHGVPSSVSVHRATQVMGLSSHRDPPVFTVTLQSSDSIWFAVKMCYSSDLISLRFWPAIDSALRAAACTRGVQVRLLVSCWKHSPGSMFTFLQSLLVLNRPPLKCDIDVVSWEILFFARLRHGGPS